MNLCRNVRAAAEEPKLPSPANVTSAAFMCVMDALLPPMGDIWRRRRGDGGRYHLQSAHKAAAEREQSGRRLSDVSRLFHFLCGRKLSRHAADRRRRLSSLHLSGFYWSGGCFVWTDCHSFSSTCSQRARRGEVEAGSRPADLLDKHFTPDNYRCRKQPQNMENRFLWKLLEDSNLLNSHQQFTANESSHENSLQINFNHCLTVKNGAKLPKMWTFTGLKLSLCWKMSNKPNEVQHVHQWALEMVGSFC